MAGDGAHPASQGPAAMTTALRAHGRRVAARTLRIPPEAGHVEEASLRVACELAAAVHDVSTAGQAPLVFAGSCDVAPGVLAGLADDRCGVIWIDAHADFNTPDSSRSGFLARNDARRGGRRLRRARPYDPGCCRRPRVARRAAGRAEPLARRRGPTPQCQRLTPRGLAQRATRAPVAEALDRLATHVERVYVHLDLDALDPSLGRGVVDAPVPGGLTVRQLVDLLRGVRERFAIAAATIATYVPANDDGRTLPIAVAAAESSSARTDSPDLPSAPAPQGILLRDGLSSHVVSPRCRGGSA